MFAIINTSRDHSRFSLFTAGLACLVPFASAYTKPVGEPNGNPIYEPGLNSIVPAGQNYTVTWQPTTPGTVTLVLLKGPSSNAVPQYAIAEKIANTGSYVWAPSTDLAPQDTGYGIQLIVDSDGQYQYTTQFGISNPDYSSDNKDLVSSSASASASVSSSQAASQSSTATSTSSCDEASMTSTLATATASASTNATALHTRLPASNSSSAAATTGRVPLTTGTGSAAPSSGYLPSNGSILYGATGTMTVPASLRTTASASGATGSSSSAAAVQTGAAAEMATSFAGLVVAAGVAVFAL